MDAPAPATRLTILRRDDHLVVVSKPPGMLSVPTPGVEGIDVPQALAREGVRARPVHRLDREVSGVLLLALDEAARTGLEQAFRERAVAKTYWALAQGLVEPPSGAYHFPILEEGSLARVSARGKRSLTRYRTLRRLPRTTELEVDLVTGRYNQIRLHLAHAGHPLVGERKYARGRDASERMPSRRVALHAWRIGFAHPITGERVEVEAPLPEDLRELLARAARP